MRSYRRSARRRGGSDGSFWLSFSDLMSSLVLIIILVMFYIIYQYFNLAEINEAEIARREFQLDQAQTELEEQQTALSDAEKQMIQLELAAGDLRLVDLRQIEVLIDDVEHHQYDDDHQGAHQIRKAQPEASVASAAPPGRSPAIGTHSISPSLPRSRGQRRGRDSPLSRSTVSFSARCACTSVSLSLSTWSRNRFALSSTAPGILLRESAMPPAR